MKPEQNFPELVSQFDFDGSFLHTEICEIGHINNTYASHFCKLDGTVHSYLMQRINHNIFKQPEELMENIAAVTEHLRKKIISAGGDPNRETLTLIPTKNGNIFHRTDAGDYWRAFNFIENAATFQIPQNLSQVYNAAWAFGKFMRMLDDFPIEALHETIPDFHNTTRRYKSFMKSLEKDSFNRAHTTNGEIEFVLDRAGHTSKLVDLIDCGELPIRVTHNDTKLNNVMIDRETGEGLCVVDLDTVMPGSALYDFGDAIRSITNTAEEDERDLSKVHFSMEAFEKYAQGYLDVTHDTLTSTERNNLAFSAWLITLEQGIRFLTDHLDGDSYFRIKRDNHNLDRCRTQFKLVKEMEENFAEMEAVVERYARDSL